jgi:glycosyltransferase involved in cell wall biosynthesis
MKPVSVVYIITKLELGGAQKVCLHLFRGLQERGYASFLVSGAQGVLAEQVKDDKAVFLLDTFTREIGIFTFLRELQNFLNLLVVLYRLKKKDKNLVVHTHSTKAGFIGRWAAFFAGIKTRIHTIHGFGFHPHQPRVIQWIHQTLEFFTSLITTHYVCVSSADVALASSFIPHFAKKYSLIRAAVENDRFLPAVRLKVPFEEQKKFIIGTISCFKPQKNLFDLLKAFSLAREQRNDLYLEIIGDGILRGALSDWIARNNMEAYVTLHGWQHDVVPIMRHWHIFALSSLWEGLPCALIEARLLRLPVLSYNTGGIKEVLIHNGNGFLYNQRDWRGLAEGMVTLAHDEELYDRFSNYPDNLSLFSKEEMINRHISMYQHY